MARYRLRTDDGHGNRTGPHCMGKSENGKFRLIVKPGDIVVSDQPLDKLFRNKFERIEHGICESATEEEVSMMKKELGIYEKPKKKR